MENQLFNLKFTSKQFQRQAKKSEKEIKKEKLKLKKAIETGNTEGAKIYAENAIRYKNQATNYLRLGSRLDAFAARLETEIRMNQVSRSMGSIVMGMDKAMKAMDLEKISGVMDRFEQQFEDLEVQSQYVQGAMGRSTALSTPQDQVDSLIQQVKEEYNLEVVEQLHSRPPVTEQLEVAAAPEADDLSARLQRLKSL
eukprot:TRINITY_DN3884_c0_g1_i1.p1 TRINITY_DN3884_c0_g1~~TRINITY_DN3884_c0_g1_i1.p1  ORF type:complete len:213 (-),score=114.86 TRINITY_DN3884_c0_g1_i1:123-713(-)